MINSDLFNYIADKSKVRQVKDIHSSLEAQPRIALAFLFD